MFCARVAFLAARADFWLTKHIFLVSLRNSLCFTYRAKRMVDCVNRMNNALIDCFMFFTRKTEFNTVFVPDHFFLFSPQLTTRGVCVA